MTKVLDRPDQRAERPPAPGTLSRVRRAVAVQETGVVLVLLALVAVIAAGHPRFLAVRSVTNLGQQSAFFGIIALGMVFLLAMREIDLSVGGNYAVTTIVAAVAARDGVDP